jgi:hypothetical protein
MKILATIIFLLIAGISFIGMIGSKQKEEKAQCAGALAAAIIATVFILN